MDEDPEEEEESNVSWLYHQCEFTKVSSWDSVVADITFYNSDEGYKKDGRREGILL